MAAEKWENFDNKIIKQGNSYCVRIPRKLMEKLRANESDWLSVKVQKIDTELTQDKVDLLVKLAEKIPGLKSFSKAKLQVLAAIHINENIFLVKNARFNDEKMEFKGLGKNTKIYREQIKKEFGEKIYRDYVFLMQQIEKNAKKKIQE